MYDTEKELEKQELDILNKLLQRLHYLEQDIDSIRGALKSGAKYHNLYLLEMHVEKYRELCAKVKKE